MNTANHRALDRSCHSITAVTRARRSFAHEAQHGAVDGAGDSQAADVGVAGGDAQRDPLCVVLCLLACSLACHVACLLAGAHVDSLGGAQADGLGGSGSAEERDHRAERVGGARDRLDVLGVHADVCAGVEVTVLRQALRLRGTQLVEVEQRGDSLGHAGGGGNTELASLACLAIVLRLSCASPPLAPRLRVPALLRGGLADELVRERDEHAAGHRRRDEAGREVAEVDLDVPQPVLGCLLLQRWTVSSCSRSSRAVRPARRSPDEPPPAEPPPAEPQSAEPPSDEPPTQFLRIYTGPCMASSLRCTVWFYNPDKGVSPAPTSSTSSLPASRSPSGTSS
jgi:hypothetical protein